MRGMTARFRPLAAALLILFTALASPAPAQAQASTKIAGVAFDNAARVDGQELRLNGVGTRTVAWFTGYAAGLYLAQPASTPGQAMGGAGPKRLQMRMLVDVPVEEFIKAFHKGVGRNMPAALQPALAEPMAQFDATLRGVGQVKKGDVINLDFVPAKGLLIAVNGQLRGQPVPGADHYAALLSVFLGERPVDDKMKVGLLGGKPK
jgi:Chalcone isomerase-like